MPVPATSGQRATADVLATLDLMAGVGRDRIDRDKVDRLQDVLGVDRTGRLDAQTLLAVKQELTSDDSDTEKYRMLMDMLSEFEAAFIQHGTCNTLKMFGVSDIRVDISGAPAMDWGRISTTAAPRLSGQAVDAAMLEKIAQQVGGTNATIIRNAAKYLGEDGSTFRAETGAHVTPGLWCADFSNEIAHESGLSGTGSSAAISFNDIGVETLNPQAGNYVVMKRNGGGHVGIFVGFGDNGKVLILGGNQGGRVCVAAFDRSDVVSFRRMPESATSAAAAPTSKQAVHAAAPAG